MRFIDQIIYKFILKKGFSCYPEDKYLIKKIIKFSEKKNPKVIDVCSGNGNYPFLSEKFGAQIISFDFNNILIEKANEKVNCHVFSNCRQVGD